VGLAVVAAGGMPGFLSASLAPRIRADFAFGDSALGLAAATFYVVCMLTSTPLARVVDRIGARRGMLVSAATTAAACVGTAAFVHSAAGLTAMLALAGLGNAFSSPAVSKMLQAAVPTARHGLAFGLQQAGAPLGALLGGLALPAVAIPLGWRWAYVGVAVLALVAALSAPAVAAGGARAASVRPPRGLGVVHAIGLAAVLASAAGMGLVAFIVVYAVDHGMDEGTAGLLLAAVSLCAAVGRIGLGLHADRSGQDALRPLVPMFALSAVGYLLLITGQPVVIVVAALLVGALGWSWTGALNLAVVQHSPDAAAWAVGVMLAGLFAGAIAGPIAVGFLAEHEHWTAAWIVCALFALAASAVVAAVRRHDRAAAS
jgi:MFS family permease